MSALPDPDQPLYGLCSGGRSFPKTGAVMSRVAEFHAAEIVFRQKGNALAFGAAPTPQARHLKLRTAAHPAGRPNLQRDASTCGTALGYGVRSKA